MKFLILSDSHYYNEYLTLINTNLKEKVDRIIHCGDSSLTKDDSLISDYLCVKGNHDYDDFPLYIIENDILITHGHEYNVYSGYEELISLCKKYNCKYCFHGHTHIPTHQIHNNIHFINPGSLMMNRGQYGFGTFAIAEINEDIEVNFYHHETFEQCNYVLEEGLELLEEIKEMLKSK